MLEVIVANPTRLRQLSARQRSWLLRAAADATRYSGRVATQDDRLVPELCAAGVRFVTASPATLAGLRDAWRPLYAELGQGPDGADLRTIVALRNRSPAPAWLRIPSDCHQHPTRSAAAHGVRSALPAGVYRMQATPADVRDADAQGLGIAPAVETLTLRDGRWKLNFTEPGDYTEYGTYAGTPLRTAWYTDKPGQHAESFYSVLASRTGLRFYVVQSWEGDSPIDQVTYGAHTWLRIGR